MAVPIWRDYRVTLAQDADSAIYRICRDTTDNVVYYGKAWRRPNETDVVVCINDIAADYISNDIPRLPDAYDDNGIAETPLHPVNLIIQVQDGTTGQYATVDNVTFARDYSYNYAHSGIISVPIRHTWSRQAPYVLTVNTSQRLTIEIYKGDAIIKVINYDAAKVLQNDYNADFSADFARFATLTDNAVVAVDLSRYTTATRVVFTNGDTIESVILVDTCSDFVLYYLNSYGGWDGYIIDGALAPSFGVERGTFNRDYLNDYPESAGVVNYRNDITRRAQVRTGWLTDGESETMAHNLFASPLVYLYNIKAEVLTPVRLTGADYEVKTYNLNSGNLVNYALDIEVTRTYTRR